MVLEDVIRKEVAVGIGPLTATPGLGVSQNQQPGCPMRLMTNEVINQPGHGNQDHRNEDEIQTLVSETGRELGSHCHLIS